jgi:hypothetical protein
MHLDLAQKLAVLFSELPQVDAVALGGSQATGATDSASDIDLYVYTQAEIPVSERQKIVERAGGASRADIGLAYWGPGDEWFNQATGIEVDIVYFDVAWMESQLQRVLVDCQPSLGYTTCFWHTLRHSQPLYDPQRWFQELQTRATQDYPDALRFNIVHFNHPVLRQIIPSYTSQIEKALKRRDLVSLNHRLAALLASYFDILFALNRQLHPGEKRLVQQALAVCQRLPQDLEIDLEQVLQAAGSGDRGLLDSLRHLLDHLDQLLIQEGFSIPQNT